MLIQLRTFELSKRRQCELSPFGPMICLFLLLVFLTGCMGEQPAEKEKEPVSLEQQESSESSPSSEVSEGLIYSTQGLKNGSFPPKITLAYSGDLVQVSENSQTLLVGISLGAKPCALVEVGGRGRVVQTGDLLGKYRMVRIKENEVELERDE